MTNEIPTKSQRYPNEIPTKSQRYVFKPKLLILNFTANDELSWKNHIPSYIYMSIVIYIYFFQISSSLGFPNRHIISFELQGVLQQNHPGPRCPEELQRGDFPTGEAVPHLVDITGPQWAWQLLVSSCGMEFHLKNMLTC